MPSLLEACRAQEGLAGKKDRESHSAHGLQGWLRACLSQGFRALMAGLSFWFMVPACHSHGEGWTQDPLLPVEGGMLHQGVCVPILDDHLAAHTGKALWVVLEFPSHL